MSLAWSQQGFWQPSFCRKRTLWSLCFDWKTKMDFLFTALMEQKKREDKSICHPSSFPMLHLSSRKAEKRSTSQSPPPKKKGFINYVFCRNRAVRQWTFNRHSWQLTVDNKQWILNSQLKFQAVVFFSSSTRIFFFTYLNIRRKQNKKIYFVKKH